MFPKLVFTYYIPGALSADKAIYFVAPEDITLDRVLAQGITQNATLQVSDDGTAITDSLTVTAGTTPLEFDADDFLNDKRPQIRKGSVVSIAVGHGSNCVDLNFSLIFTLG